MKIKDLIETIVFNRSCVTIIDTANKQLAHVYTGDEQEFSQYAEYEVMEVYSVQPFHIIARIWL